MGIISKSALALEPYVPGEQPGDMRYIKLNTNESPYPPCPGVKAALEAFDYENLRLYSLPGAEELRAAIAETLDVEQNIVFAGGGSDEILSYALMAFFERGEGICYPGITYGFYSVLSGLFGLNAREIPLDGAFRVNVDDYAEVNSHIVIANPNAPTGIALSPEEIERLLSANPDRLVMVDEAYVDFSDGKNCAPLLQKYKNLLIVRTFSKSYAMAGMRLGYALGAPELIGALDRIKNSFNPYNLDRISVAAGIAAIRDTEYLRETAVRIVETREKTRAALKGMGFDILPSETNFLFMRREGTDGAVIYEKLRKSGILVRHFAKPLINSFVRMTIGTPEDMQTVIETIKEMDL